MVKLIRGRYNGLAIARHGLLFPDTIRNKVTRKAPLLRATDTGTQSLRHTIPEIKPNTVTSASR